MSAAASTNAVGPQTKSRGQDPCVVHDDEVARAQEPWELGDSGVLDRVALAPVDEEAGRVAGLRRMLRDGGHGQGVFEVGHRHDERA